MGRLPTCALGVYLGTCERLYRLFGFILALFDKFVNGFLPYLLVIYKLFTFSGFWGIFSLFLKMHLTFRLHYGIICSNNAMGEAHLRIFSEEAWTTAQTGTLVRTP